MKSKPYLKEFASYPFVVKIAGSYSCETKFNYAMQRILGTDTGCIIDNRTVSGWIVVSIIDRENNHCRHIGNVYIFKRYDGTYTK